MGSNPTLSATLRLERRLLAMSVIGWLVDEAERPGLLARFSPVYDKTIAHHVTLQSGLPDDAPPPPNVRCEIVGEADDGKGVQAMVVEIDGTTDRPDGSTYHITWSLADGRQARESNDVIAAHGWTPVARTPVRLIPGRFQST
ncbi:MAG TPA: hypothetical protein VF138_02035 [Caulobacteraceae bacterium]